MKIKNTIRVATDDGWKYFSDWKKANKFMTKQRKQSSFERIKIKINEKQK